MRSEDPDGLLAAGEECPAAAPSAVRARPGRRACRAYLATAAVRACPGDAGADSEVALGSMATQEWVGMQREAGYERNRRNLWARDYR